MTETGDVGMSIAERSYLRRAETMEASRERLLALLVDVEMRLGDSVIKRIRYPLQANPEIAVLILRIEAGLNDDSAAYCRDISRDPS